MDGFTTRSITATHSFLAVGCTFRHTGSGSSTHMPIASTTIRMVMVIHITEADIMEEDRLAVDRFPMFHLA